MNLIEQFNRINYDGFMLERLLRPRGHYKDTFKLSLYFDCKEGKRQYVYKFFIPSVEYPEILEGVVKGLIDAKEKFLEDNNYE